MPTLTIIAGPNGSGKSTITATENFLNVVDPDTIARRVNPLAPGEAATSASREAISRWSEYLRTKSSFAVETTLAGKGVFALIRRAKAERYRVRLLYIALSDMELHVRRVRLRVSQGGHDVPNADIRRRYHRSLAHAPEAIRLADEAIVLDNSGVARQRLLEIRNGRVIWRAVRLPDWAREIESALA